MNFNQNLSRRLHDHDCGFTFFYAISNPVDIANNLQKNGGYILGIRPDVHG